jgi:hypothetical protein
MNSGCFMLVGGLQEIHIKASLEKYSLIPMHEMSHCFLYNLMDNYFFCNSDSDRSMDEALAIYLQCAALGNPDCFYGDTDEMSSIDCVTVEDVRQHYHQDHLPHWVNETFYSVNGVSYAIASALWNAKSYVPDLNNKIGDVVFEIGQQALYNIDFRSKPRYFFNLLMQREADPGQTTGLNDKQIAIIDAYNSRGLHFYPKVESISSGNIARNYFGLNEPVHVKISDCPQNTRVNIYVIKHGDYTYTDGALVTGLSSFYANGFSPITNVTTGPTGEWSGLIWTTPSSAADAVGNYDIIVNIGSPNTPDDYIHFAFSGANVMDGFDGRTKPGLSVIDNGIDVVMAVSAFSEPQGSKSSK